jgi:hypothetical protein
MFSFLFCRLRFRPVHSCWCCVVSELTAVHQRVGFCMSPTDLHPTHAWSISPPRPVRPKYPGIYTVLYVPCCWWSWNHAQTNRSLNRWIRLFSQVQNWRMRHLPMDIISGWEDGTGVRPSLVSPASWLDHHGPHESSSRKPFPSLGRRPLQKSSVQFRVFFYTYKKTNPYHSLGPFSQRTKKTITSHPEDRPSTAPMVMMG